MFNGRVSRHDYRSTIGVRRISGTKRRVGGILLFISMIIRSQVSRFSVYVPLSVYVIFLDITSPSLNSPVERDDRVGL